MNNRLFKFFTLLTVSILVSIHGFSQEQKEADRARFLKACELRREGQKYFLRDPQKAAKLFEEANQIYPAWPGVSTDLLDQHDRLPLLLIYHGDINGANKAITREIKRLDSMESVYYFRGLINGGYGYMPAKVWKRTYLTMRANFNFRYGDSGLASEDVEAILSIGFDDKEYKQPLTTWNSGFGESSIRNTLILAQYVAFLNEDLQLLEKLDEIYKRFGEKDEIAIGQINIAILKGEYEKAIQLASDFEKTGINNKVNARFLIAYSYAMQKNSAKSEEYIRMLLKDIRVGERMVAKLRVINALNDQQYANAVQYATEALKPYRYLNVKVEQPGKSAFYVYRARAYMGLKQYEKAKSDFETALLFNLKYESAIQGLAQLEGQVANEQRIDKTPPVLKILEPGAQRGLKIVANSAEIMLKGLAEDPSGIKSVTANGKELYVGTNYNFWGTVPIADGTNEIRVKATDVAGNVAETTVSVVRQVAAVSQQEIVPILAKESKNYALIIAAQNYDDSSIPSLEAPIADAIKLKLELKGSYNFADDNIVTLFNPSTLDLKKQFAELTDQIQPEDNLIIFYAGHGIWVEKEQKGYWLLTDAQRSDPNSWLSNKVMLDLIAKIQSRHTLLITDACFSGSVFKTRGIGADAPAPIRDLSERISRVAITSGNDTEVPDESVFMKYLIKALAENKEKYLTAQKMFITQIIEAVMTESKTEPRYGTLELAGHVGGDYIFTKK